jgi:hypothetical protein
MIGCRMRKERHMARVPLLVVALALSLLAVGPAAAQIATPDPEDLPRAAAPLGLAGVDLPTDEAAIASVFAALPATVGGERQETWITAPDRIQVPYGAADPAFGHPLVLGAISFAAGDFFPADFTAGDYVAMTLAGEEAEAASGGRDGDLAWVRAELSVGVGGEKSGTPAVSRTMHTLVWGAIDGGWVFTAIADTPERLDALVTAFVEACAAASATPAG